MNQTKSAADPAAIAQIRRAMVRDLSNAGALGLVGVGAWALGGWPAAALAVGGLIYVATVAAAITEAVRKS